MPLREVDPHALPLVCVSLDRAEEVDGGQAATAQFNVTEQALCPASMWWLAIN